MEALSLWSAVIETDASLVDKADHDGEIAPVIHDICEAWLRTAAPCAEPSTGQLPQQLIECLRALCASDGYGMRTPLQRAL